MNQAAEVLKTIIDGGWKEVRSENRFLKSPQLDTHDWFFFLPSCFNSSLDIALTPRVQQRQETLVWTQGHRFRFQTGDLIYNHPKAYEVWGADPPPFRYCVQVQQAREVTVKGQTRDPGFVVADLYEVDSATKRLEFSRSLSFTQDDFVKFLIEGPSDEALPVASR